MENKLKLLRLVNLKDRQSSDQMLEILSDVVELAEEQQKAEEGIMGMIRRKKERVEQLNQEHQRKMNELLNNQARMQTRLNQ